MGIKGFFPWFVNRYSNNIYKIKKGEKQTEQIIDNFLIDLNGIFHTSAQKIYKYGNFKEPKRLLSSNRNISTPKNLDEQVYIDVCNTILTLVRSVNPKKRVILCIDGVAPKGKQNQQRMRRFKAVKESKESSDNISNQFDSNTISPGTIWMHNLSIYIDSFIKNKISEDLSKNYTKEYSQFSEVFPEYIDCALDESKDVDWSKLEIIFSSEKDPGEGEQKLLKYIRNHGNPSESFCTSALDADLIVLSLGATQFPNFYLLREDQFNEKEFYLLNIGKSRNDIVMDMKWKEDDSKYKFNHHNCVCDFVLLTFFVGNDFLPNIPFYDSNNMLDNLIEITKEIGINHGHLTDVYQNDEKILHISLNIKNMKILFEIMSQYEKILMKETSGTFPDEILIRNTRQVISENGNVRIEIDSDNYVSEYIKYKLSLISKKSIFNLCKSYLDGIIWTLNYYIVDLPSWNWFYPYHYSPFPSTILNYITKYKEITFKKSYPCTQYQQLISILPPASSNLLPSCLKNILIDPNSPIQKYCPQDFDIDLSGMKKEWQGIAILPFFDFSVVEELYSSCVTMLSKQEKIRNSFYLPFKYKINNGTLVIEKIKI